MFRVTGAHAMQYVTLSKTGLKFWTPRKLTDAVRFVLRYWSPSPAATREYAHQKGACSNDISRQRAIRPRWNW